MTGPDAWAVFVQQHPELGYRPGRMNFHNFLRLARTRLIEADAIRRARGRHWIAHTPRFIEVAFDLATMAQAPASRVPSDAGRFAAGGQP